MLDLPRILADHENWLRRSGGIRADLRSADLRSADLRSANLSNANLGGADLSSANLSSANLSNADLRNADLRSADLSSANLSNANLSNANLGGADLRNADLRSANLRSANLSNANLSNAKNGDGTFVSCAFFVFTGHGECGRQLLAVKWTDKTIFYCGCFVGSPDDLVTYIKNSAERFRLSRLFAMEAVTKALEFSHE